MPRLPAVPGYVLVDRLHRGPAADVWRASRESDGRPVAVKVPSPGPGGADTEAEAALLQGLRHPNLVGLVDSVLLDDGRTCVVTDLADGGSLADLVAARGRLTVGEVTAVLAPVADALWALHRGGLVHGDVSPGNVLFTAGGRPLLTDLGAGGAPDALTGIHGTEGFVAAEVLGGEQPSAESDVFALGAVAVHALTGHGVSPLEQVDRVLRRCADVVDVPAELETLLRGVLAGTAAQRPRAVDVARALAALADPEGPDIGGRTEADLVTYRVRAVARAASGADPDGTGADRRSGRRRGAVVAAAGVAAVAVVILAWQPVSGVLEGVVQGAAPAPQAATSAGSSTSATSGADDPAHRAGAASHDPGGLLTGVLERRARAVEQADAAALAEVDVPQSWAARRDGAIVRELLARGERHRGLRFSVRDARVVSASARRTTLDATVAVGAYRYVRAGVERTAPAAAPRRERYELAWDGSRWRISRVSAVTT